MLKGNDESQDGVSIACERGGESCQTARNKKNPDGNVSGMFDDEKMRKRNDTSAHAAQRMVRFWLNLSVAKMSLGSLLLMSRSS